MSEQDQAEIVDYIDPNSGRAPQPGGAVYREPMREDMVDVAVADQTTEEQESEDKQPTDQETETEQVEEKENETEAKSETLGDALPKRKRK